MLRFGPLLELGDAFPKSLNAASMAWSLASFFGLAPGEIGATFWHRGNSPVPGPTISTIKDFELVSYQVVNL
jgi:hypothetical protein